MVDILGFKLVSLSVLDNGAAVGSSCEHMVSPVALSLADRGIGHCSLVVECRAKFGLALLETQDAVYCPLTKNWRTLKNTNKSFSDGNKLYLN